MKSKPIQIAILAVTVVLLTALFATFIAQSVSPYVAAQQPPPTTTPTRPPTPTPPVIPEHQIPQTSFKGPPIDIPKEARQVIPDKDFTEVFCLTSRWQIELFYRIMDIWGPGFIQLKEMAVPMGVQVNVPDVNALKAEGKAKAEAVCAATTVEAAQAAVGEVLSFGSSTQDTFIAAGKDMEARFREVGTRLQEKIEAQVNEYADKEKARAEKDIQAQITALIPKSGGPGSIPNMQAITGQINTIVKQKIDEITRNITDYANGVVDKEVGPFKKLDSFLTDLGSRSEKARATDTPQGAELKRQAIAKRKQIVQRMLDVNIARARSELEASRADLDLAKRRDPSVKNVDDILAELARDRKVLEQKIDAALASNAPGPEAEFQFKAAIDEFIAKWTALSKQADKQRPNAISIRDTARPQLIAARTQLLAGAQSITQLLSGATGKTDDQSKAITAQASRLNALKDRLNALAARIDEALAALDKVTVNSPVKPVMDMLESIQRDGDALQNEIGGIKTSATKKENVLIQAEDEVVASVSKPGTNWDSVKEVKPSWRAGWTGNGDWYLSREGDKISYKFNIQNPGTFYMWVRDWDDGKHKPGSGAINIDFSWGTGSAQLKNIPENSVRNSQHQWHQVGQVVLGAPGQGAISMTVTKAATTSKAAILDAFFLSADPNERPPENPPPPKKSITVETILIQAEEEASASVSKPGTNWDSTKEVKPSWRTGWTGSGDWYLSREGDKLNYKFNIQSPGKFYVWVRDWDDGKHKPGSGTINIDFTFGSGTAQIKNVTENSVRNSQHQWHQAGQVNLGAPGQINISMTVTKSATTSKAAILDAFFLTNDPAVKP